MINPPQVRPEEPIAVTPHDGICGGKSQQWLSYPTNPHVRFDERGRETERCHTRPKLPRPSSTLPTSIRPSSRNTVRPAQWPSIYLIASTRLDRLGSAARAAMKRGFKPFRVGVRL